jgi:hypothetical protein
VFEQAMHQMGSEVGKLHQLVELFQVKVLPVKDFMRLFLNDQLQKHKLEKTQKG